MITGELKNKIDSLWDIFAAGGLVNPLDVIEQITYLMFIHDLDDSDNLRAKEAAMLGLPYQSIFADEVQLGERTIDGQQLKWSVFHDFPAQKMYATMQEWVFPFIKNLHGDKNSAYSKYMDDAIFKLPTPLLLSKVVDALDEIYRLMNESQAVDVRGDTYEYLLRLERSVPHTAPYHQNDGRADGSQGGRNYLRPRLRHFRLSRRSGRVPERAPQRRNLL